MKKVFLSIVAAGFLFVSCKNGSDKGAASSVALNDDADSISYFIGFDQASNLKKDFTENERNMLLGYFKDEAYLQGVKDALESKSPEVQKEIAMEMITAIQMMKKEAMNAENKVKAQSFLEGTDSEEYQTTPSGLKYVHLVEGTGKQPSAANTVKVHYHGMFTNGQVFDSSVERGQPIEFPLTQVIQGWTEGLQLMKEGGKTKFYIPWNLAYGEQGSGPIGPKEDLIFIVELFEVK